MMRMESEDEERGSPVMKSIKMEFQGHAGMERNLRGLYAVWCDGLAQALLEGEIPAVWSPLLMLNYLENEF
jgi:hypothetical protein